MHQQMPCFAIRASKSFQVEGLNSRVVKARIFIHMRCEVSRHEACPESGTQGPLFEYPLKPNSRTADGRRVVYVFLVGCCGRAWSIRRRSRERGHTLPAEARDGILQDIEVGVDGLT